MGELAQAVGMGPGRGAGTRTSYLCISPYPFGVVLNEFVQRSYVVLKIGCYSDYKAVGQNIDDDGAYP